METVIAGATSVAGEASVAMEIVVGRYRSHLDPDFAGKVENVSESVFLLVYGVDFCVGILANSSGWNEGGSRVVMPHQPQCSSYGVIFVAAGL